MNFKHLLLFLTLPLYLLDQATKFWTVGKFPPPWSLFCLGWVCEAAD